ncbi:MAG: hypothetical protein JO020_00535 [Chloroflexi bacterium]|nr:hypothetical protein [Chloroflexota bacterium]
MHDRSRSTARRSAQVGRPVHSRRVGSTSPFRSWLYRIATNACIDSMRRAQRRVLPHQIAPATPALDAGV